LGKKNLDLQQVSTLAWFDGEVTIRNRQVRTDFLRKSRFSSSVPVSARKPLIDGFF